MNALFVHGMGRSSLSWTPTLLRLRSNQVHCSVFDYSVARQDFSSIVNELVKVIVNISLSDNYIVVGHSLGGVLLRAALDLIPVGSLLPKFLFLLGSPTVSVRFAERLKNNFIFKEITGDCGDLLGSSERMSSIPIPKVSTVAIIGIKGIKWPLSPFGSKLNDGIVSVNEVSADWFSETVHVPVVHTFLPSSKHVSEIILDRVLVTNRERLI